MRQKTCISCKKKFIPERALQRACSYKCALDVAAIKREKAEKRKAHEERQQLKADKEKIKSRREWIQDVQKAVNSYIRARDHGMPCISCGKETKAGDHAGHWKPTSSSPELRFEELNIHLQCVQCNLHLHGNVAKYREGLIQRIGLDKVEWLESKHLPKNYSIEELKELKALYKQKLKERKGAHK